MTGHLLSILGLLALTNAGLLRVPKVYNAVITSNQNLSPSRAFPVIQPVIHRTAIGYVSPFYYTQVLGANTGPAAPEVGKNWDSRVNQQSKEPMPKGEANDPRPEEVSERTQSRNKTDDQLSFYPNYHSLYYDPYIYTYNGYSADAGSYYVDYQPYSNLASPNRAAKLDGHQLPAYHRQAEKPKDEVPEGPASPLAASGSKHS